MRVRVHLNLHNGKFNISTYRKGLGWRLYKYVNFCILRNVTYKVSQAGNAKVRREGKKNVHAFMFGELLEDGAITLKPLTERRRIRYNPYENTSFVDRLGCTCIWDSRVACKDGKVYAV